MNVEDEVRSLKSRVNVLQIQALILAIGVGLLGADALIQSFRIDALM